MAEESEGKDKSKLLNSVTSEKGIDTEKALENVTMEENTLDTSVKNIDINVSRNVEDSEVIDEDARLTWALSLGNDADLGDSDDVWDNKASEEGNSTDDEDREDDTTLDDTDHDDVIINNAESDNCIDIYDELTNAIDSMRIDPLNVECEARNNDHAVDQSEEVKGDGPTITETPKVKLARIVFDATDMDKGCKTMRLKADNPMKEIKKLFPKHLSAAEDTFMLQFNNQEVENETPHELFGDNLERDNNVIKIVKSIKIRLGGQPFLQYKGRYLDERPNTHFGGLRRKIANFLKEPQALIGLVYNGKEILNEQTPESIKMGHGHVLVVIKKERMKIRFRGSVMDGILSMEVDPNATTMKDIKSKIASYINEDHRKIMFIYKDGEPSEQLSPVTLNMSDTDILNVIVKVGAIIKIEGPVRDIELFYPAERPFKALLQFYSGMVNKEGKQSKSFVFRLNGVIVEEEDTVKSLTMADGDCIAACENFMVVFQGPVLTEGFVVRPIDSQMKFLDVRKQFGDRTGVDYKDLVFTIGEEKRVVGDNDTLKFLKCNGVIFISVSVEQCIQVKCMYLRMGQELQTFPSKMRLGKAMQEWKYEISSELGEPGHYLSFMWEDSDIPDLETPEQIGIKNGDTVVVCSSSMVEIQIERDGHVITGYCIHRDLDFLSVAKMYSQEYQVGINSFGFKLGERYVDFSDTANEIGLTEGGTIQVLQRRLKNVITVEFCVENSLSTISPRLNDFPVLWDASTVDQVFLIKYEIGEMSGLGDWLPFIVLSHKGKELTDGESLQEIGVSKGDKISIDVREHNHDEKEITVYVKRNMKETKSSMGNGWRFDDDDDEFCAFKLDSSKPLSEFIKKVKSRITCNSKKNKLFLSLNGGMVNKDDFGPTLPRPPFENCFKCHAFPNLEAFRKHLETSMSENMSFENSFDDSDDSFSSDDLDFSNYKQTQEESSLSSEDSDLPTTPPNYKHNHGDEKSSEESKKDIEKKLKAMQMRINVDKKKKEKNEGISLAKDIQNHKDFENVDDILKFIGEEDSMAKTSKENKDQVGTSKRRKGKNKKKNKTPTTSKDTVDKYEDDSKKDDVVVEVSRDQDTVDKYENDSKKDDVVVDVSRGQDNIGDDKQNKTLDALIEDNKNPRNKEIGKGTIDLDGDGCNAIKNSTNLGNIKNADEDSTMKTTEGNDVKVRSLGIRKQMNANGKETYGKASAKNVMDDDLQEELGRSKADEQSQMKRVKNKRKKQKRKNQSNKSKDKTELSSIKCNTCTFINYRETIFCEVCGDDLSIKEQNWEKVGAENKRKLPTKAESNAKSNLLKSKTTTFSHSEKLLQKEQSKTTPFSHHEKLLQESDLKTKDSCLEEHVSESIRPRQEVPTFCIKDSKPSNGVSDAVRTKLEQVESKTEIFLESEKATESTKIEETVITNKFTSKDNGSRKDANSRKKWTSSERHDYRQPVTEIKNKIPEESKNSKPEPVLTETEEETRKWCQLMVAARKRRDEERKRDYLKFLDMQARNTRPQLEQTYHKMNDEMFANEVSAETKPVVPQPKGTGKYVSGNTQGASIPREGWPQGFAPLGPAIEANNWPNPSFEANNWPNPSFEANRRRNPLFYQRWQ